MLKFLNIEVAFISQNLNCFNNLKIETIFHEKEHLDV